MATYKHGVYTSEQATSMTAPVTGTAGLQVVVGTAPVNMLEHPEQAVNTPLLAYNYKEAVAAVGYHDDFAAYTLCESISAAFSVVGTGPLVLINVLDPAKRKTTRALLTLTERKTRKEIIIAIPNRKAETVVKALDALERKLGARRFRAIFKSITFDNGTEFAAAEGLERSCVNKRLPRTKVYFCHPYSSWERGTNENTNGMIRRRFPKGTNFAAVTNAQITQAENWINNYPRKILGYKSSEIVFRECLRELGIAA